VYEVRAEALVHPFEYELANMQQIFLFVLVHNADRRIVNLETDLRAVLTMQHVQGANVEPAEHFGGFLNDRNMAICQGIVLELQVALVVLPAIGSPFEAPIMLPDFLNSIFKLELDKGLGPERS